MEIAELVYTVSTGAGGKVRLRYHAVTKAANLSKQDSALATVTLGLEKRTTVWSAVSSVEGPAPVRDAFRLRRSTSKQSREIFLFALAPWCQKQHIVQFAKSDRKKVATASRQFLSKHFPDATPAKQSALGRGLVAIVPPVKVRDPYYELSEVLSRDPHLAVLRYIVHNIDNAVVSTRIDRLLQEDSIAYIHSMSQSQPS